MKSPDLTGKKFHRLTVISQNVELFHGQRQSVCTCVCECGNTVKVLATRLQKSDGTAPLYQIRSCGCAKSTGDLTGMKFNKLLAIEEVERSKSGARMWRCRCDCGNEAVIPAASLKSGKAVSCGCMWKASKERISKTAKEASVAAHAPEVEAKRSATAYGKPGSEARKVIGDRLQANLKKTSAMVGHANIALITASEPNAKNPYRGVCRAKNGRWIAYCTVSGNRWVKTGFATPEEAKVARDKKQAELITLYGLEGAIEKRLFYKKNKKKGDMHG